MSEPRSEDFQATREATNAAGEPAVQSLVSPETATGAAEAVADGLAAANGIDPFVFRLAIFVMAVFVGYYVVWSVTPALHTPLMSVTNAISSVIVVGALLAVGVDAATAANAEAAWTAKLLGFLALVLASINIVGGFMVTQRMLAMYRRKA
ncbi:MAG: NAD(P) transhydrogenase subunit alpha [Pseudomonadota bacterium]